MSNALPPPPRAARPNVMLRLYFFMQRVISGLSWVFFGPLLMLRLKPRREFAREEEPTPPDYQRAEHWAARPEIPRKSTVEPAGGSERSAHMPAVSSPHQHSGPGDGPSELQCDVFYVHPTMHLSGESWNAPLDHERINELVNELVVPGQASAFARTCRVFAPRYRQATLYSFLGGNESCRAALELAYSDVRAAFEHYLEHDNQGRPFFLASHSQGSCHAIRLLEECVESRPEVFERMICAYVLGYTVPRDKFEPAAGRSPAFSNLKPSAGPHDLHCVVAWDTYGHRGGPLQRSDRAEVWYSGQPPQGEESAPSPTSVGYWRRRADLEVLGIHPFTFDRRSGWVSHQHHLGAVRPKLAATISPLALFFSKKPLGVRLKQLSEPYPQLVAAALGEDGYLFITEPPAAGFQRAVMPGRNFHNHDWGLFYCDLEANIAARAQQYLADHDPARGARTSA